MSPSKSFISLRNKYDRVILLVSMDYFFCQVEEKMNLNLVGKPVAVLSFNTAWQKYRIIALNHAARTKGVTRHMLEDEAKQQCPCIVLVRTSNVQDKPDLAKYYEEGKKVVGVLQKYTRFVEQTRVDKFYLDISESVNKRLKSMAAGISELEPDKLVDTYVVGYQEIGKYITDIHQKMSSPYPDEDSHYAALSVDDIPAIRNSDIKLLIGASIATEIRAAVKELTEFKCSAGIAHNKIIASLACGINIPNKQTILPLSQLQNFFEMLPVDKMKGLRVKFSEEICENLNIRNIANLSHFTETQLQREFGEKNGTWLYYLCRGIDLEAVTSRFYSKSIRICKKFPNQNMVIELKTLQHWLNELANEISDLIEKDWKKNNRKVRQMVVSYIQEIDGKDILSSFRAPLLSHEKETLIKTSLDAIKANTKNFVRSGSDSILQNPIKFLEISVGKFETIAQSQNQLTDTFANQKKKKILENEDIESTNANVELKKQVSINAYQYEKSILEIPIEENGQGNRDAIWENLRDSENVFAEFIGGDVHQKHTKIKQSPAAFSQGDDLINKEETKEAENSESKKRKASDNISLSDESFVQSLSPHAAEGYHSECANLTFPQMRNEFLNKCDTCGAVLADEINLQMHLDRHFAFKLSQQQREEYRLEITKKINQKASDKKGKKKQKKSPVPLKKFCDIKKFFKPKNTLSPESLPLASLQQSDQFSTILCSECHQYIKKIDMFEHSDFHVAEKLQRSLNQTF